MNKTKTRIAAFVAAIVIILAAILSVAIYFTVGKEDSHSVSETGVVTDENGKVLESEKTHAMPTRMLFAAASERAQTQIKLTATIEPAYASDKSVDWTVEWATAGSWASGKNVSDYITVTPDSDGSLTATVTNKSAFGEKIKITVRSRQNRDASAECVCDYVARMTGAEIAMNGTQSYVIKNSPELIGFYVDQTAVSVPFTVKKTYTAYTVADEYTLDTTNATISLTEDFVTSFNSYCSQASVQATFNSYSLRGEMKSLTTEAKKLFVSSTQIRALTGGAGFFSTFLSCWNGLNESDKNAVYNAYIGWAKSGTNYQKYIMAYEIPFTGSKSNYTLSAKSYVNKNTMQYSVTGITLNETQIEI